jgi:predicted ATPase/class 3 adenylate cyclase
MADQTAVTGRPTGTVTILFTDIEGSTRLLQALGPEVYGQLLADHHRLIRQAVTDFQGVEVKTEGDSFFVVFPLATDALAAAAEAQLALCSHRWPTDAAVRVRMGIHTGEVRLSESEYVGIDVHRAARISAAAHGGQVLLSGVTRALVETSLGEGLSIRDVGEHRLKDIDQPEHLYQLVIHGLPSDFPPPHALATRFDLLPAETSTFVGREDELAQAQELLAGTRLLTLTGPGGTGKTRLAVQLARKVADDYADGVAFVGLAAISDPRLVPSTIRQALGLAEQQAGAAMETLVDRLKGREVLLVLDNFEQVAAAASTVGELLEAVPGLTMVVTSRIALHLTGEQEFAVPPLSVPTAADATDLSSLSRSDAVALFVQRARAVRADFELTPDNARAIVDICARLDGLPLAIELAASRIKLLPVPALLERLSKSLDILQSTAADRTDRQRTLRGAIDWSYNLLAEPERALFRRLSIFVGGWRLDEAEKVTAAAGTLDGDLLDGTAALVDHSLVRRLDDAADVRFGMLETIREFGLEQLEIAGEGAATGAMHADCFTALAAEAEPHLTEGREWSDRLEAEHANIRAAIARLSDHDIERCLEMCGQLWRFWQQRGHLREGARLTVAVLDNPRAVQRTHGRAKALIGLAGLVYWQMDFAGARARYEEALSIAHEIGDPKLEVEALYSLAYVRDIEGDAEGAESDLRDALRMYREQGDELMATWALETIGMVTTIAGRHEEAVPIIKESIAGFERLGDAFGLRNALAVLSRALMHLGRLEEARTANLTALELASSMNDVTSLSSALLDAASLFALSGQKERAAILIGAAQKIMDDSGGQPPPQLVNRIDALPALKTELEPARLAELIAQGRKTPIDEAAALAVEG